MRNPLDIQSARIGRPLRRIRVEPKPEVPKEKPAPQEPVRTPKREPVPAK